MNESTRASIALDSRRSFSSSQRARLFEAAAGRCQACAAVLDTGWHADHVVPWSSGGRTEVSNGQALCPPCNLTKGTKNMQDRVELRGPQQQLLDAVLDNINQGKRVTVGLLPPGTGKTLAWQAIATHGLRQGLWDKSATFVPRTNLSRQAELDWSGQAELDVEGWKEQFADPKPTLFQMKINTKPLVPPGGFGYVSSYQALTTNPDIHHSWAREHEGRFLMVLDEAQFLAMETTASGRYVQQMSNYAAHIIILTGTPYRSDGKPLTLCADRYYVGEDGKRYLQADVHWTYKEAVNNRYLVPFQWHLVGGTVDLREFGQQRATTYDTSKLEEHLGTILSDEKVWPVYADAVIERVKYLRQNDLPNAQGLITCVHQGHARHVHRYLVRRYPEMRTVLALSDMGDKQSLRSLTSMKEGSADILVCVNQAYIGFDCKPISVIGCLSSTRWSGWLEQTAGRGLRIQSGYEQERQHLYWIAPDDPQMAAWCEQMIEESEEGLRERREREAAEREASQPSMTEVEAANINKEIVFGSSSTPPIDGAEAARIRELKSRHNIIGSEHDIKALLDAYVGTSTSTLTMEPEPPRPRWHGTVDDKRRQCNSDCTTIFASAFRRRYPNINGDRKNLFFSLCFSELNKRQGLTSIEAIYEDEDFDERIQHAEVIADRVRL